jgi:NADPH:quinone reductase
VVWTEAEEPVADGGVVVDVVAAGVSYADLLQTTGEYQLRVPVPFSPGMDAAGVVRSAPPEAGVTVGQLLTLAYYGLRDGNIRALVRAAA